MRRNAGYTLLEAVIAITLFTVGSGAAIVQLQSSLIAVDSDVAANMVVYHLKLARETSVNSTRPLHAEFIAPNLIRLIRHDVDDVETVISDVVLPSGFTFGLPTGIADTPEGYGNEAAIDFEGDNGGTFLSDGIFVDGEENILSGTIFTIGPNGNGSARAVTLSGASGRVKQYFIRDGAWVERSSETP